MNENMVGNNKNINFYWPIMYECLNNKIKLLNERRRSISIELKDNQKLSIGDSIDERSPSPSSSCLISCIRDFIPTSHLLLFCQWHNITFVEEAQNM
jgi:hypothetical protein